MALALAQAQRGLGRVWPNPSVGCVIADSDGHIAGLGRTQDGGRPHAETQALAQAGIRARGATAYVSLEPCSHQGQTGPCAGALIAAGVARVVSATQDPDVRVSGKGIAMLRAAGIDVRNGVMEGKAREVNAGFFSRVEQGRPLVTLKLATTLDGKIALPGGESRWITGAAARAHVHLMRAQHDGVMVGIGSALADDPELTCRLPGLDHSGLVRIVVDSTGRLPVGSKLAASAGRQAVWLLTSGDSGELERVGVRLLKAPSATTGLDLVACMQSLGGQGLTRVLVEGGAALATSLLRTGLVDRLLWYRAPTVMGEGLSAVTALAATGLGTLPRFIHEETLRLGEDMLETYRRGVVSG